ncbi:arrestin domain-containing protein 3-like [Styela clava]|uniref:arrestin domain-containing protein 1-like n=1 Tax=Styela clava TaxID=7725 RepID=UPI0019392E25|nr:arrestin domain-containing protein 1-like [Styela clava]
MGKHGLTITYLNNRKVYAPGDYVQGAVEVELKKPKKIKKIKVNAVGESIIKLKTPDGKQLRNQEKYFHFTFDVFAGSDHDIQAGQHRYPFQFQLKQALPTSFEGNYGHVRYSIKAVVEYPGILSSRDKCLSAFTVLDTVDLNNMPSSRTPLRIHCEKKASGMCWWKKGAVTVDIATEKTGYVAGEFIKANGIIVNGRSRPIKSLKVELWQLVTFFGRLKNSAPNSAIITHEMSKAVSTWTMSSAIGGDGAENWQNKQLMQIPPLIPSGLRNCSVIDVQYYLKVVMIVPGGVGGSEISGRSNYLTIGSVPLMTSPPLRPPPPAVSYSAPQAVATAPPLEFSVEPSAPPPAYDPGDSAFASVPLPSYEEAVTGGAALVDDDLETSEINEEDVRTPDTSFTPQYAFFDFSQTTTATAPLAVN